MWPRAKLVQIRLRVIQQHEDVAAFLAEQGPCFGQPDRAGRARQQLNAEPVLQSRNPLADGRKGDVRLGRGSGEAAVLGDKKKNPDLLQVVHVRLPRSKFDDEHASFFPSRKVSTEVMSLV